MCEATPHDTSSSDHRPLSLLPARPQARVYLFVISRRAPIDNRSIDPANRTTRTSHQDFASVSQMRHVPHFASTVGESRRTIDTLPSAV